MRVKIFDKISLKLNPFHTFGGHFPEMDTPSLFHRDKKVRNKLANALTLTTISLCISSSTTRSESVSSYRIV